MTQLADIIKPERFTKYGLWRTMVKTALWSGGAVVGSARLNNMVASDVGGTTLNMPAWKDLPATAERISTDSLSVMYNLGNPVDPAPGKITTEKELAVRMDRNYSWTATDLADALAGENALGTIQELVAYYWQRRQQQLLLDVMTGVFADNALAPNGTDTHLQNDLTFNASNLAGANVFADQITNFTAVNYINAKLTMGDAADRLSLIYCHSTVHATIQKNNLIDYIRDSENNVVETFRGARIVIDDQMPNSNGVYETWLFGPGAIAFGQAAPPDATEIARHAGAGNGGGQTTLYNRVRWVIHPRGYKYVGSTAAGEPTNATFQAAATWSRAYPERKQVAIARLITREAPPA
jgi:hypothetical protein